MTILGADVDGLDGLAGQMVSAADRLDLTRATVHSLLYSVPWNGEDAAGFKLENTIVNLLTIPAARELIDPAPVAERAAGSRFQLTIWVDDADAACAALAERGVELVYGPADRGWGMRTGAFSDPDGHIWEVAQELEAQ